MFDGTINEEWYFSCSACRMSCNERLIVFLAVYFEFCVVVVEIDVEIVYLLDWQSGSTRHGQDFLDV